MEAYTGFAQVYDLFMDNVPYRQWSEYLISLLNEHGVSSGLVLDLGCGTGKMTRLLARAGYDMIGVDSSPEMLEIAVEQEAAEAVPKEREAAEAVPEEREAEHTFPGEPDRKRILYLCQDMREFELYGTVAAAVSICDSMNYLLEEEELLAVFRLVNNYLDPGGVFIFDMNTLYKYRELLGDTTICENRDEGSFIWENYFDEEGQINAYDLTLYVREEDGRYRRFQENHYQRGYEPETVRRLLEAAGMEFVAVYDAFTREPPAKDSERIYFVARERGKQPLGASDGPKPGQEQGKEESL